jgi:multidrug resistance protein MdtO
MERPGFAAFLKDELEPFPGRLAGSLRDTLSLSLAVVLVLTLRIHAAAIGVYFILLLQRQHPSLSLRSAIANLAACCCGVGSCLVLIQLTDNDPLARIFAVIVVMALFGFMVAASNQGASAVSFALFWFVALAAWESHLPATRIVENTLWLVAATGVSSACGVAVEYLFGSKTPAAELIGEMNGRLDAAQRLFTLYAEQADAKTIENGRHRVIQQSHAGQARMQRLYGRAIEHAGKAGQLPPGTRVRIPILADLADLTAAYALSHPNGVDDDARALCARLADLCTRILQGQSPEAAEQKAVTHSPPLDRMEELLHDLSSLPVAEEDQRPEVLLAPLPSSKEPIFAADAFTNPAHIYFGLKTALAATSCYIIYNAIGWPGLSTSVITVLVTALSTTAAMKQKQIFRLIGAFIGGLIGIFSVAFLFPHMDSITEFVLLNAAVTFLAVWWSRSPHSGYVGYQIALAYYLVALQSFNAPVQLTPARDRVLGVALGLVVMWFVFDQMWPLRTTSAMSADLATMLRETAQLFRLPAAALSSGHVSVVKRLRHSVGQTLMRMRDMRETVDYEIGTPDRREHVQLSESLFLAGSAAATLFWTYVATLQRTHAPQEAGKQQREALANNLEQMAATLAPVSRPPAALNFLPIDEPVPRNLAYSLVRYNELQDIVRDLSGRVSEVR